LSRRAGLTGAGPLRQSGVEGRAEAQDVEHITAQLNELGGEVPTVLPDQEDRATGAECHAAQ
jgi:hypothetical protein